MVSENESWVLTLALLAPLAYVAFRVWRDTRHLSGRELATALGKRVGHGFLLGFALLGALVVGYDAYYNFVYPHTFTASHPCFDDDVVVARRRSPQVATYSSFAGVSPSLTRSEVLSLFGTPEEERGYSLTFFNGALEVLLTHENVYGARLSNRFALLAGAGIDEAKARFLGHHVKELVETLGPPSRVHAGNYTYTHSDAGRRIEAQFTCYEHRSCLCSIIEVRWNGR